MYEPFPDATRSHLAELMFRKKQSAFVRHVPTDLLFPEGNLSPRPIRQISFHYRAANKADIRGDLRTNQKPKLLNLFARAEFQFQANAIFRPTFLHINP